MGKALLVLAAVIGVEAGSEKGWKEEIHTWLTGLSKERRRELTEFAREWNGELADNPDDEEIVEAHDEAREFAREDGVSALAARVFASAFVLSPQSAIKPGAWAP